MTDTKTEIEREEYRGLFFHPRTCRAVRDVIASAYTSRGRIRVFYGDPETGRNWHEENDVSGTVGRSSGRVKIPLIVHPRSIGGPGMIDNCVIAIVGKGGRWLYKCDGFEVPSYEIERQGRTILNVMSGGVCHAVFTCERKAARWIAFMTGRRIAR